MSGGIDRKIADCIAAHAAGVAGVYLFRLLARGDGTPQSDVGNRESTTTSTSLSCETSSNTAR